MSRWDEFTREERFVIAAGLNMLTTPGVLNPALRTVAERLDAQLGEHAAQRPRTFAEAEERGRLEYMRVTGRL